MHEILPSGTVGSARRINNGQVVGRAAMASSEQQAFLCDSSND
jgi:hypothetical protein